MKLRDTINLLRRKIEAGGPGSGRKPEDVHKDLQARLSDAIRKNGNFFDHDLNNARAFLNSARRSLAKGDNEAAAVSHQDASNALDKFQAKLNK